MSEQISLPEGWANALIEDIFDVLPDGKTLHQGWSPQCKKEPSPSEDIWGVLKTTAIQDGDFLPEHNKELPKSIEPRPNLEVKAGDILITCAGPRARCGVPCLVRSTRQRLLISGKMYRFRVPENEIDPAFVEAYLRTLTAQQLIDKMKTGGSESGLNMTHARFRPLPVTLAPTNEQRRIVAKIESLESHREAAQEVLEAIPPLLERFRQSVLAAAFRGDLTREWRAQNPDVEPASVLLERIRTERKARFIEGAAETARAKAEAKARAAAKPWADTDDQDVLDKERGKAEAKYKDPTFQPGRESSRDDLFTDTESLGWCAVPLEMVCDPVRGIPYGIVTTGDPVEGGHPTVRCGDVREFRIDMSSLKLVSPDIHEAYRRTWLRGGEVLLAIRGTVGNTAVAGTEMAGMNISREVAMIPPLPGVEPKFLMYLIACPQGREQIMGHVKGVAQSGINLADLRRVATPIPPEDEQRAIVEIVEGRLAQIDRLEAEVTSMEGRASKLIQSILAQAFRGELVPQDPNDEPASVLLERIRAERAETEAQGKSKKKAARKTTKKTTGKKNSGKASS